MKVLIIFSVILVISSVAFAGKDDLKRQIATAGNKLIVLDFYTTWCSACGMIGPKFDQLATLHRDVIFIKIDGDEHQDIADEYRIANLPTFIFIKNGRKIEEFSGAKFEQLRNTVLRLK